MNGYKILGVILATIAFYLVGFLWYGVLFSELWMSESGFTEQDYANSSPAWMGLGIVLTIVQVIGATLVLSWRGHPDLADSVKTMATMGLLFAAPFAAYALTYSPHHSIPLYLIDASHLIVGFCLTGAVLSMFRASTD